MWHDIFFNAWWWPFSGRKPKDTRKVWWCSECGRKAHEIEGSMKHPLCKLCFERLFDSDIETYMDWLDDEHERMG